METLCALLGLVAYQRIQDIGEVWANILHNIHAALVMAHGFSATAFKDPTGSEGNVVFLHLFLDALALQPCNPTCMYLLSATEGFILLTRTPVLHARGAWIQADMNRFAGANKCILWKAFASRGLGVDAAKFIDGMAVPAGC